MSTRSILVVEDYAPWRLRLRELLQGPEWRIVETCNGLKAVQKAAELRPENRASRCRNARSSGIEAAEKIQRAVPQSKIIL